MELNSAAIHDVIHPTAAFVESPTHHWSTVRSDKVDWCDSYLNPKNRIDSLDLPLKPLWRIDGGSGMGERFFAVPLFLADVPPMRFDVFIPQDAVANCSPALREALDLAAVFHTKDEVRLRRLGIFRHILRTLQLWIQEEGFEIYTKMCETLPFGSRIIFENLHADIHQINILVMKNHDVETTLLGLPNLQKDLKLSTKVQIPEGIDIKRLSLVKQLYESVSVVRLKPDESGRGRPQLWVLKALTSDTKYFYVELRNLLQMAPNPYLLEKPKYLVTKRCNFGGKQAVIGFLVPFHPPGSLRDQLPMLRMQNRLPFEEQSKWAASLISAVYHLKVHDLFYPDLRLDNILLSSTREIVMADFEQRGVWCEFAAPEINAIEYIRILASDGLQGDSNNPIPEDTRQRYARVLDHLLPGWDILQASTAYSEPRPSGYRNYNIAWLCLDEQEREAAMVYMLGRVIWCIYEGQSAPNSSAVWQSYPRDTDLEFPNYRRTPPRIRELIDACTRGRRDTLASKVVRHGNQLVVKGKEREGECTERDVRAAAAKWWTDEVAHALAFVLEREEKKSKGEWDGNFFKRPVLKELLFDLLEASAAIMKADVLEEERKQRKDLVQTLFMEM
ncbi:hypothetical protein N0V88_006450 [Collariella sp. IMI 366227]|nr:hypothetical protein N0V88_006450 [Collariella sp. IMI 366227]